MRRFGQKRRLKALLSAFQNTGSDPVADRHTVIRIIFATDDQMPRPGEQFMAVAAEMAQLNLFAHGFVLGGQSLYRLQGGLIHNPAFGKINDHGLGILFRREKLGKTLG